MKIILRFAQKILVSVLSIYILTYHTGFLSNIDSKTLISILYTFKKRPEPRPEKKFDRDRDGTGTKKNHFAVPYPYRQICITLM
jgi:hypothetical protein